MVGEKKFGFKFPKDSERDIQFKDDYEIDVLEGNGEGGYIVSNSQDVDAEIYAPEINFYLKNSQDRDPEKLGNNVYRLFQARNLFYLYSTDLPEVRRIENSVILVGDSGFFEEFEKLNSSGELEVVARVNPEDVARIEGVIGSLKLTTKDNSSIEAAQVLFLDRPDDFERVGVIKVERGKERVAFDEALENAKYGYEYVKVLKYDQTICQHHNRQYDVCGFCADVCPVDAIVKVDDPRRLEFVDINCTRCGGCVSICPSGAMDFRVPDRSVFHMMSKIYKERIPLIIPENMGFESLDIALKEDVLPFVVGGKKFLDESHLLTILQESGAQVVIFNDNLSRGTKEAIGLVNEIYKRKYGKEGVLVATNLDELRDALDRVCMVDGSYNPKEVDVYKKKREIFSERLEFIVNGDDLGEINTFEYIHYGLISVDESKCTLCLSCAGACNVEALKPFENDNSLRFNPSICTMCGYCVQICPEECMSIKEDVIYLNKSWFVYRTLAKDELFRCIVCGKPFAPAKSIKTIAERMIKIWGEDDPRVKTLYCCPDCKPKVMLGDKSIKIKGMK